MSKIYDFAGASWAFRFLTIFLLTSVNTLVDSAVISIQSPTDLSTANSANCYPVSSASCNLRSAWAACVAFHPTDNCILEFLDGLSNVDFDPSLGSLSLYDGMNVEISGKGVAVVSTSAGAPLILFEGQSSTLSTSLTVQNISLQSFGSVSSSTSGGSLSFTGNATIVLSSVICSDVRAVNGGCLYVTNNLLGSLSVVDSSFDSCEASIFGGSVYIGSQTSNVFISRSSFSNSSASGSGGGGALAILTNNRNISITSAVFTNCNTFNGSGGSIYLGDINHNISLSDCSFRSSSARYGGAIALNQLNKDVAISGTVFWKTTARTYGGAVYVDSYNSGLTVVDTSFVNSTTTSSKGGGGAMYFNTANSQIVVKECTVNSTSSTYLTGGFAFNTFHTDVFITDVLFDGVFSGLYGGAMYFNQFNQFVSINSIFVANIIAGSGGIAWFDTNNSDISVANVEVSNSEIYTNGIGVAMGTDNKRMSIDSINIHDNVGRLPAYGGCVYMSVGNSYINISNVIASHITLSNSGVVVIMLSSNFQVSVTNATSRYCKGVEGATIGLGDLNHDVYINDVVIQHGRSAAGVQTSSVGISVGIQNSRVYISNVLGEDSASMNGALVYIGNINDYFEVRNVYIRNHTNLAAGLGGGIRIDSLNTNGYLSNIVVRDCVATNGGGLMMGASNTNITIRDSVFENNKVSSNGGGIYTLGSNRNIMFFNISVHGNTAKSSGGGVMLGDNNVNIVLVNSTISHNEAAVNGGGIQVLSTLKNVTIVECTITDNFAGKNGGGIYTRGQVNQFSILDRATYDNFAIMESEHPYRTIVPVVEGTPIVVYNKSYSCPDASELILLFDESSAFVGPTYIYIYKDKTKATLLSTISTRNTPPWPGVGTQPLRLKTSTLYVEMSGPSATRALPTSYSQNIYGFKMYIYPVVAEATGQTLISGNSASSGGGLFMNQNTPFSVLTNVVVKNNRALVGGGVGVLGGGGVQMQAVNYGTTFSHVQFINNSAVDSNGGGLSLGFGQYCVQLYNCIFDGNHAKGAGGGLSFGVSNGLGSLTAGNEIYVTNNIFTNNVAHGGGGAIHLENNNVITLYNSSLNLNSAPFGDGGALDALKANTLTISSSSFRENTAINGGAVSMVASNAVSVVSSKFVANSASVGGGALNQQSLSTLAFSGAGVISQNSATYGGAILSVLSPIWSVVSGGNVLVDSNVANFGSAMFFSGLKTSSNELQRINLTNNEARVGGTIFWVKDSAMESEPAGVSNVFFENNAAKFGERIATQAVQMLSPSVYDVTVYKNALTPAIVLDLFDAYGQKVAVDGEVYSTITSLSDEDWDCGENGLRLQGEDIERGQVQFANGSATWAHLEPLCAPKGYFGVAFSGRVDKMVEPAWQSVDKYTITNTTTLKFRRCEVGERVVGATCEVCPDGSYSVTKDATSCTPCTNKEGVKSCYKDQLVLDEMYWRRAASSNTVLYCNIGSVSCKGGNHTGNSLCEVGFEGPLCSICSDGYYEDGNQCLTCQGTQSFTPAVIIYIIILVLFVCGAAYYASSAMKKWISHQIHLEIEAMIEDERLAAIDETTLSPAMLKRREKRNKHRWFRSILVWIRANYDSIVIKVKIVVATMQVVVNSASVLRIAWPTSFYSFLSAFFFTNLNLPVFGIGCSRKIDFVDKLALVTLVPIILAGAIIFCYLVNYIMYKIEHANDSTYRKYVNDAALHKNYKRNTEKIRNRYVNIFLYLTYIVLPSVTTYIFKMFVCTDIDPNDEFPGEDHLFLLADTSISCTSARYDAGLRWAIIAIVIYPIGIPLMYFVLLFLNREEIQNRNLDGDGSHPFLQAKDSGSESLNTLRAAGNNIVRQQTARNRFNNDHETIDLEDEFPQMASETTVGEKLPIGALSLRNPEISCEDTDVDFAFDESFYRLKDADVDADCVDEEKQTETVSVQDVADLQDSRAESMDFLPLSHHERVVLLKRNTSRGVTFARQETTHLMTTNDPEAMDKDERPLKRPAMQRQTSAMGTVAHMSAGASRLSFLWHDYEPHYWYWEIVETMRRLTLTAVLSICSPGSSSQNVFSIMLAFVYIKIYSYFYPYESESDNIIAEVGQYQIFFLFFFATILQNNLLGRTWDPIIGVAMIVMVSIVVAVLFYQLSRDFFNDREEDAEALKQRKVAAALLRKEKERLRAESRASLKISIDSLRTFWRQGSGSMSNSGRLFTASSTPVPPTPSTPSTPPSPARKNVQFFAFSASKSDRGSETPVTPLPPSPAQIDDCTADAATDADHE